MNGELYFVLNCQVGSRLLLDLQLIFRLEISSSAVMGSFGRQTLDHHIPVQLPLFLRLLSLVLSTNLQEFLQSELASLLGSGFPQAL